MGNELKWTKKPPSEAGEYYLRDDENKKLVTVFPHQGKYRFTLTGMWPGVSVDVVSSNSEWLGPV